jgi:hypothetical protein
MMVDINTADSRFGTFINVIILVMLLGLVYSIATIVYYSYWG